MSTYAAGAIIPFTETFVQGSITTGIPLVGQVLNNGMTNFVGYGAGSADYILPSSESGASQTTLADGNTYYISVGPPPSGITLPASGIIVSSTGSSGSSATAGSQVTSSSATNTGAAAGFTSTTSSSGTGSAAAQSTSSTSASSTSIPHSGSAGNANVGGLSGLFIGFMTLLGMLV